MNKIICGLLGVLVIIGFGSCMTHIVRGEGNKTTVTPAVGSFNSIEVTVPLKAIITVQPGAVPSIKLDGYENIIKHIKTNAENNTLTLSADLETSWTLYEHDGTVATIIVPSLSALSLTGAADADIHGSFSEQLFKMDISGSGDVTIDSMSVGNFSTRISGAGNLMINGGNTQRASYQVSGAAKIKAFGLQTAESSIEISGAAKAEVTAGQKLDTHISGAGRIWYKGHPAITQDVSGAGSIKDAN